MWFLLETMQKAAEGEESLSFILKYWRSGGWLMAPLGLVCFAILYRYLVLRSRLKAALASPPGFFKEFGLRLERDGGTASLCRWLSSLPGAKARIARHLVLFQDQGLPFREGYRLCQNGELVPFHSSFTVLSAMVVAAPLLGLLGTVLGMVETFQAVAFRSSETMQMVAGGISQALITTQAGLVAALPGAFGLAHLFRLFKRLEHEVDGSEGRYMRLLERRRAATAAAGGDLHEVA